MPGAMLGAPGAFAKLDAELSFEHPQHDVRWQAGRRLVTSIDDADCSSAVDS